jgi:hypothetical protein
LASTIFGKLPLALSTIAGTMPYRHSVLACSFN